MRHRRGCKGAPRRSWHSRRVRQCSTQRTSSVASVLPRARVIGATLRLCCACRSAEASAFRGASAASLEACVVANGQQTAAGPSLPRHTVTAKAARVHGGDAPKTSGTHAVGERDGCIAKAVAALPLMQMSGSDRASRLHQNRRARNRPQAVTVHARWALSRAPS